MPQSNGGVSTHNEKQIRKYNGKETTGLEIMRDTGESMRLKGKTWHYEEESWKEKNVGKNWLETIRLPVI